MLPDLLVERRPRRRHGPVADTLGSVALGVRGPDHMLDRCQIPAALGQHRVADIDVVTEHVRRAVEAVIDHAVLEQDLVAADLGLDPPDQVQVLAEHRRLLDDALAPERALVAVPDLAVAGEPRRDGRDPAVDRAVDRLAVDVVVVGRVLAVHEQDVVEAAGDDQAGERAQPGQPTLALVLVQPGMAEASRRVPADGSPRDTRSRRCRAPGRPGR